MNYKFILTAFFALLINITVSAQDGLISNDENQIKSLKNKITLLQKNLTRNSEVIRNQEIKTSKLQETISENQVIYTNKIADLESKTTALLSEYSNKINNQEKEIAALNERLNTKNFDVYLYIALALVVAIVLFVVFMKKAIANAITQQGNNWSDFLSYIVKR
jgi:predicted RNase H-like nuclease (RuvC/YqgF family)